MHCPVLDKEMAHRRLEKGGGKGKSDDGKGGNEVEEGNPDKFAQPDSNVTRRGGSNDA